MNIRPFNENDSELLLKWRNEETTREQSFNTEIINLEDHKRWLSNLDRDKTLIFIIEDKKPVGCVRFDKEDNSFIVSVSITENERGKGYGYRGLKKGCDHIKKLYPRCELVGLIKPNNITAVGNSLKAGFKYKGLISHKNQLVIKVAR